MSLVSGASPIRKDPIRKDHWIGDILGLSTSLLCLVHCLALPFLAVLFPFMSSTLHLGVSVHLAFIGLAVFASFLAFRQYAKPSRRNLVLWCLLASGFAALLVGAFLHGGPSEALEVPVTLLGVILLAGAHWRNISLRFRPAAKSAGALAKA